MTWPSHILTDDQRCVDTVHQMSSFVFRKPDSIRCDPYEKGFPLTDSLSGDPDALAELVNTIHSEWFVVVDRLYTYVRSQDCLCQPNYKILGETSFLHTSRLKVAYSGLSARLVKHSKMFHICCLVSLPYFSPFNGYFKDFAARVITSYFFVICICGSSFYAFIVFENWVEHVTLHKL